MKTAAAYKYLPPELADRLRPFGLAVRRAMEGPRQGQHRSPHHGSSVEFSDYREYTHGDPPNLIDWAVYARSDRYVIRRYQEETSLRAYLLLDTSESMNFKEEGLHPKMEYAAYLTAAFMYVLINQGDSAGLVLFNHDIHKTFQPSSNLEGLRPMLLGLEDIKPAGRSGIEAAMHTMAERIKSRSLIILVSDLLCDPAQTLRGIRHLQHNGHEVTVMHLLDPAEVRLKFAGLVELRELETSQRLVVQADEVREAYAFEVQRYIETLRSGCVDSLAEYHLVETRQPVEEALRTRMTRM